MAERTVIELSMPCTAGFAMVARLVSSGVASRLSIPYDRVQDCKLAVGEVCSAAIERAESTGQGGARIRLRCLAEDDNLTIEIEDNVPVHPPRGDNGLLAETQEIRRKMLEALVDHMEVVQDPGSGTLVKMVIKHDVSGT